jgi:hypothetical protein
MDKSLLGSAHYLLRIIGDAVRPLTAAANLSSAMDREVIASDVNAERNSDIDPHSRADNNVFIDAQLPTPKKITGQADSKQPRTQDQKELSGDRDAVAKALNDKSSLQKSSADLFRTELSKVPVPQAKSQHDLHSPLQIIDKQKSQVVNHSPAENVHAGITNKNGSNKGDGEFFTSQQAAVKPLAVEQVSAQQPWSQESSRQKMIANTSSEHLSGNSFNKLATERQAQGDAVQTNYSSGLQTKTISEKSQSQIPALRTKTAATEPITTNSAPPPAAQPVGLYIGTLSIKVVDQCEAVPRATHSTRDKLSVTRAAAADTGDSRAFIRTL